MFGAFLYSASTQLGDLHQLSLTMSRVTYFFLRAHTGTVLATINAGKTREGFGKNAGKWTGRIEISKEEIPGNMSGYIRTCFRPRRENL